MMAEPTRSKGVYLCATCSTFWSKHYLVDGICRLCRLPRPVKTAA